MNKVVVVIPIYKDEMSDAEKLSLQQVRTVLANYPIYFMAPEKMLSKLSQTQNLVEYFPNSTMDSRLAYSKLLLTQEFYKRFYKYDYMLIYQLDAFVFCDRLEYFCSLGYDYIGAAMPRAVWSTKTKTLVGNGGLSLRKIKSCIYVTEMKEKIYEYTGWKNEFERAEDEFFSYCGGENNINFNVPNVAVANQFAIEFNVAHSWREISNCNLPFGCHGWSKSVYFDLWRPYIEAIYGKQKMDKIAQEIYSSGRVNYIENWYKPKIYQYLLKRIMRRQDDGILEGVIKRNLLKNSKCIIWGNGIVGKRCQLVMNFANLQIAYILDSKAKEGEIESGVPVLKPRKKLLLEKKYPIIVATTTYYREIKKELNVLGLKERLDYISWLDLQKEMVNVYYTSRTYCTRHSS